MSQFNLEFPVLVEKRKNGFVLSPLLVKGASISNRRYADGVLSMQKFLRKRFLNCDPTKMQLEQLLWYRFNPQIRFELPYFAIKSGMKHIEGHFSVAYYTINGHRYACLPKFDSLTLRIPIDAYRRELRNEFIADTIIEYFRELKRTTDDVHYDSFISQKSDSYAIVDTTVEIERQRFTFKQTHTDIFASLFNQRAMSGSVELSSVGDDLVDYYPDQLQSALFREEQIAQLCQSLFEGTNQAVVLVGKQGVGRTNLIHAALKSYLDENRQKPRHHLQKIWHVDPLRVVSGMSIVGQWERRFEAIMKHLKNRLKHVSKSKIEFSDVLYVDNPVALLRIGKTSQTSLTLSHLLKPYLDRRDLPVVLEATQQEWQLIQQLDRGFADLFQVMRLERLSNDQLNRVYTVHRAQLEHAYDVELNSRAMSTILKTEPRFRGDGELPGSLISLLQTLSVRNQGKALSQTHIYASFESQFHFKKKFIDRQVALSRKDISEYFIQHLVGQKLACEVLTNTVMAVKAQFTRPSKPLNTMLFIGPTGVGKTEAAKLLASCLFDREECLVRIDMNEFSDEGAIERLIGSQYRPQGILTDRVRYARSCVLLLDEIEKSHIRVHDLLLQLLDDGRLSDASGRTTDFSQCIIVMTSNVGASDANSAIGFSEPQHDGASYMQSLERDFRPELINRINNIVLFNALQLGDMSFLAKLHLAKLLRRDGFARRKIILNVDQLCLNEIACQGYDASLGARALKRNLEKSLTSMTAAQLARIITKEPIVLNIQLVDRIPSMFVTVLRHVPAELHHCADIPDTPTVAQYAEVLRDLEVADTLLMQLAEKESQSVQHITWRLSGAIRDISESLQQYIWDSKEREQMSRKALLYRMPKTKYINRFRQTHIDMRAVFASNDMYDYLKGASEKSDNVINTERYGVLRLFTESRLLNHATQKLAERGVDRGVLRLVPLGNEAGADIMVQSLVNWYVALIEDRLGEIEETTRHTNTIEISVSGCGLKEIFNRECGVHLFVGDQFSQFPVLLQFMQNGATSDHQPTAETLDIVRLYTMSNNESGYDDIVDLRTGISVQAPGIDGQSLFVYPAINP